MGRPELGTKCICTGCSERFYDLNRSPAICPKCGVEQPPEKPRVYRPARPSVDVRRTYRQPVPVAAEDDVEPVSIVDADDEEDEDSPADDIAEIDGAIETDPDLDKTPD
jgi:uncharacterized protein (TIGR02300 family)